LSVNNLYSEIILEHYKEPHNVGELDCPEVHAKGFNESCGDDICVYAKVKDGIVEEVKFVGKGCAISQSSASMMTDMMNGNNLFNNLLKVLPVRKNFRRPMIGSSCRR
jgi:nitrogen fixation NifU-like protein